MTNPVGCCKAHAKTSPCSYFSFIFTSILVNTNAIAFLNFQCPFNDDVQGFDHSSQFTVHDKIYSNSKFLGGSVPYYHLIHLLAMSCIKWGEWLKERVFLFESDTRFKLECVLAASVRKGKPYLGRWYSTCPYTSLQQQILLSLSSMYLWTDRKSFFSFVDLCLTATTTTRQGVTQMSTENKKIEAQKVGKVFSKSWASWAWAVTRLELKIKRRRGTREKKRGEI